MPNAKKAASSSGRHRELDAKEYKKPVAVPYGPNELLFYNALLMDMLIELLVDKGVLTLSEFKERKAKIEEKMKLRVQDS